VKIKRTGPDCEAFGRRVCRGDVIDVDAAAAEVEMHDQPHAWASADEPKAKTRETKQD
jgi:hypothetical protein